MESVVMDHNHFEASCRIGHSHQQQCYLWLRQE